MQAVEPVVHAGYPLDAGAVLLIEVEGLAEEAAEQADTVRAVCERDGRARGPRRPLDPRTASASGPAARARSAPSAASRPTTTSSTASSRARSCPPSCDGVYEACERYGFPVANVFHAGDGNLHPNILFDERDPGATERVLDAGEEIMRLCVDAGGSITGEHGIGLEKRDYMTWIFTEDDLADDGPPQDRLRRRPSASTPARSSRPRRAAAKSPPACAPPSPRSARTPTSEPMVTTGLRSQSRPRVDRRRRSTLAAPGLDRLSPSTA